MVFIGPNEDDYIDYPDLDALYAAGDSPFVRILTADEYKVSGLPRFENLDI